jgi:hypothetical protein
MSLERLGLPVACLLLVLGLAGAAGAQQTYLLGAGSGGAIQIGGGLPLPIQLTDGPDLGSTPDWGASGSAGPTMGVGAGVFPPLLIPPKAGILITGTTAMTMGQKLTVPAGALSHAPLRNTLGVNVQNNKLYAVATDLGFKWPAAPATLMQRTMTPTVAAGTITFFAANTMTVWKGTFGTRKIRYKNTGVAAPFGGPGAFNVTPVIGGPGALKPTLAVTVYAIAKIPTGNPPCTHTAFLGPNPACAAALLAARPSGPGVIGGVAKATVTTPGGPLVGKNVAILKAGATPKGTIILKALAATNPLVPTNMALSTGAPWSTGLLDVSAPGAAGTPEHFWLSGSDMRTAMGAGTVSLVSGSVSLRTTSGPNANRGWVRLVLEPFVKTPSVSDWGLVALGGSLLAVGAFAGLRRARATA